MTVRPHVDVKLPTTRSKEGNNMKKKHDQDQGRKKDTVSLPKDWIDLNILVCCPRTEFLDISE